MGANVGESLCALCKGSLIDVRPSACFNSRSCPFLDNVPKVLSRPKWSPDMFGNIIGSKLIYSG